MKSRLELVANTCTGDNRQHAIQALVALQWQHVYADVSTGTLLYIVLGLV